MKDEKCLTLDRVCARLRRVRYDVRGPVAERAAELQREIDKGAEKKFGRVVWAHVGDCQALGQPPLTFIRQVMAAVSWPALLRGSALPADVCARAAALLEHCNGGSVGAYSESLGCWEVRRAVAARLQARDGVPAHPEHVVLGAGATDLVKMLLSLLAHEEDGKPAGVMVPIPQYPLFSGALAEYGLEQVGYYLDEERQWGLDPAELQRSLEEARARCNVRAIVVINPGNPTGQVMSRGEVRAVLRFARTHRLLVLADEVYHDNVIDKPFHSFRKVCEEEAGEVGAVEVASVVSCSKGLAAECGARAGALHVRGFAPPVLGLLHRARALLQCPPVLGQCVLHCVMSPPEPGEPSYVEWSEQCARARDLLRTRARAAHRVFNSIPGYSCNVIEGGMFAFPRVSLSEAALRAAALRRLQPDLFYCLALLEDTGICVVPGSGFGQRAGTYHFRTTILHRDEEFNYMMDSIKKFHLNFIKKYPYDV